MDTFQIPEETPPGVALHDFDDYDTQRKNIFDGMAKEMGKAFPQSYGGVRMELHEPHYVDPENYTVAEQKKALLEDKFLHRRLRGTLRLFDDKTGEKLDEKPMTLLRVPYLTERGTFIHGGNEYTSLMQSRLLPGAYTRRQNNGGLETQFNIRSGTGTAFRVGFEPETSQYRLRVQQANLHLYSLLHDLNVPDKELEKSWGKEVLDANSRKYDARVFDKAYQRFVPMKEQKPDNDLDTKVTQLKTAFDKAMVHRAVVEKNLPNMLDVSKSAVWAKEAARLAAEEMMEKHADDDMQFWPDLSPEDITDRRNDLHGVGPNLANTRNAPDNWAPATDAHWMDWYGAYHAGRRTEDDDHQKMRWKRFRRMNVPKFELNPTPRRAYSLRAWAIDPVALLPIDKQESFKKEMEQYKADKESEHETKKASEPCPGENCKRYGAGVIFKLSGGKYLLEENHDDGKIPDEMVGKLRPAGGGKHKGDADLRETILREMEEEFGLDPDEADDHLTLLGYIPDGDYEGCAMFEMTNHGLEEGTYTATNSKHEKVVLVAAKLDDKRYIGTHPDDLKGKVASDVMSGLPVCDHTKETKRNGTQRLTRLMMRRGEFHRPENFDKVEELSTPGSDVYMGQNDWESGPTWAAMYSKDIDPEERWDAEPTYWHEVDHTECPGCHGDPGECRHDDFDKCRDFGKAEVEKWVEGMTEKSASAVALHKSQTKKKEVLSQLLKAKDHSDKKEYAHKTQIMSKLLHEHSDDFVVDDDWKYAGITHVPTGFRIHAPRSIVPASVALNPLSKVYQKRNANSHQFSQLDVDEKDLDEMLSKQAAENGTIAIDIDLLLSFTSVHGKNMPELCGGFYDKKRASQSLQQTMCGEVFHTADGSRNSNMSDLSEDDATTKLSSELRQNSILQSSVQKQSSEQKTAKVLQKLPILFHGSALRVPQIFDMSEAGMPVVQQNGEGEPQLSSRPGEPEQDSKTDRHEYSALQKMATGCVQARRFHMPDPDLPKTRGTHGSRSHQGLGLLSEAALRCEQRSDSLSTVSQEDFQSMVEAKRGSHDVIAVDLDGTLAFRPKHMKTLGFIGKPITAMKKRVMGWINGGRKVVIFTARASNEKNIPYVEEWLERHGFPKLKVTNEKTSDITEIYDDRAVTVEYNTGKVLSLKQAALQQRVLAHIAGPSGAGKTTLMNDLAKTHPEYAFRDLDEFDEQASNELKLPDKCKSDYTDEMIQQLRDKRQELMDNWMLTEDRPVVLAGHHTEGKTKLDIHTPNKWRLNTDAETSAQRAYDRSQGERATHRRKPEEMPQDIQEAHDTIRELDEEGYEPRSADDIRQWLQAGNVKSAVIKEENGMHVLYTRDMSRVLGRHETREGAERQERAIQVRRHMGKTASADEEMIKVAGEKGCLMANFPDSDTWIILEFQGKHIPEDQLAGDGYERHSHVTCLYGFPADFDCDKIWDHYFEDNVPRKLKGKLGKIKRFPAHPKRPESDVLVVEVISQDLQDLHHGLRKRYPSVQFDFPTYTPHVTLAYVKPDACKDLDGHAYFDGQAFLLSDLVYSTPGRKEKVHYELTK